MAQIVPSITVGDAVEYGQKLGRLKFAERLHIDVGVPPFTPNRTIGLAQVGVPKSSKFDLHLMMHDPHWQTETVISLVPDLVIVHFEANGDLTGFLERVGQVGIKRGLALLPETTVEQASGLIKLCDHVLVFTGHLGYYGGHLKEDCLPKIAQIKELKDVEVSVDGGINPDNAAQVVEAGADVLVSGGFIANADDPKAAFMKLEGALV